MRSGDNFIKDEFTETIAVTVICIILLLLFFDNLNTHSTLQYIY